MFFSQALLQYNYSSESLFAHCLSQEEEEDEEEEEATGCAQAPTSTRSLYTMDTFIEKKSQLFLKQPV